MEVVKAYMERFPSGFAQSYPRFKEEAIQAIDPEWMGSESAKRLGGRSNSVAMYWPLKLSRSVVVTSATMINPRTFGGSRTTFDDGAVARYLDEILNPSLSQHASLSRC
jgi:hypothetical protein